MKAVEGLKSRTWGAAAALLAWALAQLWSANAVRLDRLEASKGVVVASATPSPPETRR